MLYENIQTYLNEEVRRPIKHYLRNVDEKTVKKVMSYVDYLCDKYREMNEIAKFCENKLEKIESFHEYMKFEDEQGFHNHIDYDKLESPYTDEELELMLEHIDDWKIED